jgi:hypothetical protein
MTDQSESDSSSPMSGVESPASVADGPLTKIWKGIVREKTREQDGAPLPLW